MSKCVSVDLSFCHVTFSRPLIGRKYHRHWGRGRWAPRRQNIVEAIHVNEKEIKRGWTELCHTRNQTKKKMFPPEIYIQRPYMSLRAIFIKILENVLPKITNKGNLFPNIWFDNYSLLPHCFCFFPIPTHWQQAKVYADKMSTFSKVISVSGVCYQCYQACWMSCPQWMQTKLSQTLESSKKTRILGFVVADRLTLGVTL